MDNSVANTPAFNDNRQQTDDGVNYTYNWDAFGRLIEMHSKAGGTPLVVACKYNGLNIQIGRHSELNNTGAVATSDLWEWTTYDPRWQRVATSMVGEVSV